MLLFVFRRISPDKRVRIIELLYFVMFPATADDPPEGKDAEHSFRNSDESQT